MISTQPGSSSKSSATRFRSSVAAGMSTRHSPIAIAQLWLQWPLPDAQSRLEDNGSVTMLPDDVDLSQLKPEFEGVWLAPGSHHFAPPGAAPGTVGLLIADPEAIAALVAERWSVHWGRIAQSAGYAFLALAALIVLVGLVHKRYFKSGIADFLTPYAGYILPTSPWVQFGRISAGTLALVIALAGFVAHMLIRDNIRFNRTPFSEATLEVADLLAIPGTWLAFYLAMSFLARSGLTVMRSQFAATHSLPALFSCRSVILGELSGSAERQLVRAVRSSWSGGSDRRSRNDGAAARRGAHECCSRALARCGQRAG